MTNPREAGTDRACALVKPTCRCEHPGAPRATLLRLAKRVRGVCREAGGRGGRGERLRGVNARRAGRLASSEVRRRSPEGSTLRSRSAGRAGWKRHGRKRPPQCDRDLWGDQSPVGEKPMSVFGMKQARKGVREGPGCFFGGGLVARLAEDVETSGRAPTGPGSPVMRYLAPLCAEGH